MSFPLARLVELSHTDPDALRKAGSAFTADPQEPSIPAGLTDAVALTGNLPSVVSRARWRGDARDACLDAAYCVSRQADRVAAIAHHMRSVVVSYSDILSRVRAVATLALALWASSRRLQRAAMNAEPWDRVGLVAAAKVAQKVAYALAFLAVSTARWASMR
ncbi:MAG: hypothetical protein ACRCYU_19840, partial [Nocardioides sp.]